MYYKRTRLRAKNGAREYLIFNYHVPLLQNKTAIGDIEGVLENQKEGNRTSHHLYNAAAHKEKHRLAAVKFRAKKRQQKLVATHIYVYTSLHKEKFLCQPRFFILYKHFYFMTSV